MSTPRCIRVAIQACRPRKTTYLQLNHARSFATTRSCGADDITSGIPTPPGATRKKKSSREKDTIDTLGRQGVTTIPRSKDLVTAPETEDEKSARRAQEGKQLLETDPREALSRVPRNVAAAYHKPLRIPATYGHPTASLQLRSYSVRNLEFMADFAMRAAYYLGLPASGPVPLPRRIERWTVLRSNFVHKKSQENFERVTMKRLIQIQDGHTDVVQIWLAFLRKHQFYGVGMKANVWEYESLDVAANMDKQFVEVEKELNEKLANFGWNKQVADQRSVVAMLQKQGPRQVGVPMTEVREASRTSHQSI